MKNKYTVIGIILVTILLAGIAIFTALRLYQTRDVAVAPNVPESEPEAATNLCKLSFTISLATEPPVCIQVITPAKNPKTGECKEFPTPCDVPAGWEKVNKCSTPKPTATATPTATPTATATATATATSTNTATTVATATASTVAVATEPSLPVVGITWPTLLGTGFGILVILGSLLLAF
ncbi:MAG: hypothetical protein Q8Q30_03430 [Candidatus Woesebacteria bacterium]|nr:hypothetical protein [Candidatus Woesebacteria bacterium]